MRKPILSILIFLISNISLSAQANWFDKDLSNCIIALEKRQGNDLIHHGTGFLIYNYEEPNKAYLVTCEHVLRNSSIVVKIPTTKKFREYVLKSGTGNIQTKDNLWIFDGNNLLTDFQLIKDSTFAKDDTLDIAAFTIQIPDAVIYNLDTIKISDRKRIPTSFIKKRDGIELGTEIYFLGFPFAIGTSLGYVNSGYFSDEISNPLLRTGIVAWKSDNSKEFLLDAFSYGGNSGSPIFSKREVFGGNPYLIGMVIGHLSHPATATKLDMNIGLARCLWIDDILEVCSKLK
jgi:hypothetical protein